MAINVLEKRALMGAVVFVAVSLGLIGYATWGLGVNVPTCIPLQLKPYDQASIVSHGDKYYEVHYVARMWAFEPSVLRVPTGSTLDLYAISKDVIHGMEIVGTNINLMVVPGAIANGRIHFNKPGVYNIVCHEFCGRGHDGMNAKIIVSDNITEAVAEGLPTSAGEKLMQAKGCLACHTVDGSTGVGPTFKGAWGSQVHLTNGTTHTLDNALFEQIVHHPTTTMVAGYPPVMPQLPVTDDEMKQIESYMEGLQK